MPEELANFGSNVFNNCDKITSFSISGGASEYYSYEGVLYRDDETSGDTDLVKYPAAKTGISFTVDNAVDNIVTGAFMANTCALTDIAIYAGTNVTELDIFGAFKSVGITIYGDDPSTAKDYADADADLTFVDAIIEQGQCII